MVQTAAKTAEDPEAAVSQPQSQFDSGHGICIVLDMGQAGQCFRTLPLPAVQKGKILPAQGIEVSQDIVRHHPRADQVSQSRVHSHHKILRSFLDPLSPVVPGTDQDTCAFFQFFHPAVLRIYT